jgi:hypothetical protein
MLRLLGVSTDCTHCKFWFFQGVPVTAPESTPEERQEALELAKQIRHFEYSIQLLERNFRELDLYLTRITYPPTALPILAVGQRWRLQDAMLEVTFLLHNYVASAQSLVDHSRVLYRRLFEPKGLLPEYQPEVDARFVNHPLTQFVLKLRQMVQHYMLPNVHHQTSLAQRPQGGTMQIALLLEREDLRRFDSWNVPARQYLDSAGDVIDIHELIRAYHQHVLMFYEWFRAQQARVLGPTFEFASRLQSALFELGLEAVLAGVEGRLAALETTDDAPITHAAIRQVLLPALTLQEERQLAPFSSDLRAWIGAALGSLNARRQLPAQIETRLDALIVRADA